MSSNWMLNPLRSERSPRRCHQLRCHRRWCWRRLPLPWARTPRRRCGSVCFRERQAGNSWGRWRWPAWRRLWRPGQRRLTGVERLWELLPRDWHI